MRRNRPVSGPQLCEEKGFFRAARAATARKDGVSSGSQTNRHQPILTPAPQRTRPHERMGAANAEKNWRNIMSVRDQNNSCQSFLRNLP